MKEPFHEAIATLQSIFGLRLSKRTAELHNHRMAQHAESFLASQSYEEALDESDSATILVATADGTSVPMKTSDRTKQPASNKGPQAGTTRRAYVGATYEIEPFIRDANSIMDELFRDEAESHRPRPQRKHLWAEMAAAPDSLFSGTQRLFAELGMEVHRRDPERERVLVTIMDGERHLWDLKSEWLGRAVEVLDFFHALERVREVAKFAESELSRRETWVQRQVKDLLEGRVKNVIERWQRLANKKNAPAEVASAVTYFQNNQHRMQYDEYLSAGYPIGSGMAEGACRNLVKDRMDCTGMHWTLKGAQAMLWTRALYLNDQWKEFVEHRIQKEQFQIYQTAA